MHTHTHTHTHTPTHTCTHTPPPGLWSCWGLPAISGMHQGVSMCLFHGHWCHTGDPVSWLPALCSAPKHIQLFSLFFLPDFFSCFYRKLILYRPTACISMEANQWYNVLNFKRHWILNIEIQTTLNLFVLNSPLEIWIYFNVKGCSNLNGEIKITKI